LRGKRTWRHRHPTVVRAFLSAPSCCAMDTPTVCPRLHDAQPVADNCPLSAAERALDRLSLITKDDDAHAVHAVHNLRQDLRRSLSSSVAQSPGRRKPPRCPQLSTTGAQRKRIHSDEFPTDGPICNGRGNDNDTVQYTPRGSPAKMARSASLGRFTSVSNLAAFGGEVEKAEAGPPKVTVRPHSPSLPRHVHRHRCSVSSPALTVALDCSAAFAGDAAHAVARRR
jgi:hypothetical protein